jgi:hypothetical protein
MKNSISVGSYDVVVNSDFSDELQQELDQVLVLLGLTDFMVDINEEHYVSVSETDFSEYVKTKMITVKAKGENKGWGIDFLQTTKGDDCYVNMGLVAKLPFQEVQKIKSDLLSKYGNGVVVSRIGGLKIVNNNEAMIELLKKIKVKV